MELLGPILPLGNHVSDRDTSEEHWAILLGKKSQDFFSGSTPQ